MRQSSSSKRSCNCCRRTFRLRDEAGSFTAIAVVAAVVEVQRGFGDGFQPGKICLASFQAALIAEGLAFRRQLLVDLEVSGRYVVQQQLAEMLEFFGVGRRCLNTAQGIEGLHQLLALMQPAIDQLVHTPTALGHYGSFRACCPRFPLRTSRRIIVRSETHC